MLKTGVKVDSNKPRSGSPRSVPLKPYPPPDEAPDETAQLNAVIASKFAGLALDHLTREYPNKLTHYACRAARHSKPSCVAPIFYGSYDWHSCVHGYWLLLHLIDRFPDMPEAARIVAVVDEHFTDVNVAANADLPHNRGFERPYGWAWLLALAAQVESLALPQAARWASTIAPLTDAFVERFETFLPDATYPLRVGTHFNTAFALALTLDFARSTSRASLETLIVDTSKRWHLNDAGCQAWEPAGDEFLSPSLMEAELMRRVLPSAEFDIWFTRFLPNLAACEPATLFEPATVSDRSDGKIAHLDGLNLSRAWCQRSLARALPEQDARSGHVARRSRTSSGERARARGRRLYGRALARDIRDTRAGGIRKESAATRAECCAPCIAKRLTGVRRRVARPASEHCMKRMLDALHRFCLVRKRPVVAVHKHACVDLEHDDGAVAVECAIDA